VKERAPGKKKGERRFYRKKKQGPAKKVRKKKKGLAIKRGGPGAAAEKRDSAMRRERLFEKKEA